MIVVPFWFAVLAGVGIVAGIVWAILSLMPGPRQDLPPDGATPSAPGNPFIWPMILAAGCWIVLWLLL